MGITIIIAAIAAGLILLGFYFDKHREYDDTPSVICFGFGVIMSIVAIVMLCIIISNLIKAPYEVGAIKAKAESYQYLIDNPPTALTLDQNNLYREIIEFNEKVQIAQSKSDSFWFMGWYPKQWKEVPLIEFHT